MATGAVFFDFGMGSASTGGTGDVTGPGSSTDNAIARFDGTGGKTLQNSLVTVSDLGVIGSAAGLQLDETTAPSTSSGEGAIYVNTSNHLRYVDENGLDIRLGREIGRSKNSYVTGSSGTTVLPNDGTQPQITEGFQVMSHSYTLQSTSNRLVVRALVQVGTNNGSYATSAAIFRSGVAGALANASWWANAGNTFSTLYLETDPLTLLSTGSYTFTVRIGPTNAAATVYFNKKPSSGADLFATSPNSFIEIIEVVP